MAQQSETTHTLMAGTLLVYQRERSAIWQCRFKVDGQWQRASTKERDLKRAKEVAKKLLITAEIRKEQNMPVVTRRFKDVAKLAVAKMEQRLADGIFTKRLSEFIWQKVRLQRLHTHHQPVPDSGFRQQADHQH